MTRSNIKDEITTPMTPVKRQELAISLLERLNRLIEKKDIIRDILLLIKEYTEFEAVAIRLKEGDDYPYYETNGFPENFVKKENSLCAYNGSGDLICDSDDNPVLECMCGTVLCGKTDPSIPFFTQAGSFWTNSTTDFISHINKFNLDIHLRGLCNTKGYESQALISLRSDDEIIGLLQLNDRRKNFFSEELINYFEGIAAGIGIALKRRISEEALLRSEERYALAQRAANIGSWDWNIIDNDLSWSDTIEPMFGFKSGEFGATYEAFLESVHPDDRKFVTDSVDASIEKDEKYSIEHRIVWPNGETHWVSEEGAVIRDSDGTAVRMLGVVQDITRRKETEEELIKHQSQLENKVKERTQDLYKAFVNLNVEMEKRSRAENEKTKAYTEIDQIFSTISIGISYTDLNCNFIRFNKRFLDMFQLKEKECSGNKCYDIWNENICRTANCPIKKILSGEDHFEYEIDKKLPDGRDMRCSINSVPYFSMENEIIGIIQYYIDITEKREVQKEVLNISEKERQRIGSDLHDLIGQNLTASAFITEALRQKIADKKHAEALKSVDQIESIISSAIAQTRKITKMLNPVEMEKRGLNAALKNMAESTEEIFKISCKVKQSGNFIIDNIHDATHLFYIAREAVNNSLKHGKPKNITISLNSTARSKSMIIRDDGKGISIPTEDPGSGLRIMQYRATMIGAEFSAKNRKDGGFQVVVRLPQ